MKKTVLGISLIMSSFAFAQKVAPNGLEKIIVEKYYISNAADATKSDEESTDASYATGALPVGSVTYRIYADLLPGYKLLSVYADGTRGQTLIIKTSTAFYNNPAGTYTPIPSIKKTQIVNAPLLALDSYLTLGGAAAGHFGVPKEEDDAAASFFTSSTPGGVLLNNAADVMGKPLTEKDGFIAGTGFPTPSFLGFDAAVTDILSDGSVIGDSIGIADGVYYSTTGARGLDTVSNKVLIAQVTTNGKLEFHLNLQTQKGTEPQQYFVSRNPQPGGANPTDDVVVPSLNYPDSTATDIATPTIKTYNDVLFSVYPNPVKDNVTIDITAAEPNSKGSYTIYGVIGNVIAHKELNAINGNYKEVVDMSSFAQGLYTIQMNINGVLSAKKIIKN